MVQDRTSERSRINKSFPFMVNFPFDSDFEMEIGKLPMMALLIEEGLEIDRKGSAPDVINFNYSQPPMSVGISMYRPDLCWISEIADQVNDLDKMAARLKEALSTEDIILKRDVCLEADQWLNQVSDGSNKISWETFKDVLISLIGKRNPLQVSKLISNLAKLQAGTGIVKVDKEDFKVLMTYFHFKLIYTKLILGVVIASKISI